MTCLTSSESFCYRISFCRFVSFFVTESMNIEIRNWFLRKFQSEVNFYRLALKQLLTEFGSDDWGVFVEPVRYVYDRCSRVISRLKIL